MLELRRFAGWAIPMGQTYKHKPQYRHFRVLLSHGCKITVAFARIVTLFARFRLPERLPVKACTGQIVTHSLQVPQRSSIGFPVTWSGASVRIVAQRTRAPVRESPADSSCRSTPTRPDVLPACGKTPHRAVRHLLASMRDRQNAKTFALNQTAHARAEEVKPLVDHIIGVVPVVDGNRAFGPLGQSVDDGMQQSEPNGNSPRESGNDRSALCHNCFMSGRQVGNPEEIGPHASTIALTLRSTSICRLPDDESLVLSTLGAPCGEERNPNSSRHFGKAVLISLRTSSSQFCR